MNLILDGEVADKKKRYSNLGIAYISDIGHIEFSHGEISIPENHSALAHVKFFWIFTIEILALIFVLICLCLFSRSGLILTFLLLRLTQFSLLPVMAESLRHVGE